MAQFADQVAVPAWSCSNQLQPKGLGGRALLAHPRAMVQGFYGGIASTLFGGITASRLDSAVSTGSQWPALWAGWKPSSTADGEFLLA